ncbi:hypothetical protein D9758_014150 [Tetrapyrgos nigripes]|uniref:Uncharacterized protein n=1 Tax=Tetrapyrgos nigripes TaxID=182062 RepID=A0A8H5CME8_9AGAR|nr:hypothetical protein D9758_014150 [Tetrapyrgos nigripes]
MPRNIRLPFDGEVVISTVTEKYHKEVIKKTDIEKQEQQVLVVIEWMKKNGGNNGQRNNQNQEQNRTNPNRDNLICDNCHLKGHIKVNCFADGGGAVDK